MTKLEEEIKAAIFQSERYDDNQEIKNVAAAVVKWNKDCLQNRINVLEKEYQEMTCKPKRFRCHDHDIQTAILWGQIKELKYWIIVYEDSVREPNIIEQ